MKPKDLLRLPKVVAQAGTWKVVTGRAKMPGTAFPLSRRFSLQLGRNWHWRVDGLEDGNLIYRLLTAYNLELEEYRAWLSTARGDSQVIVAQLEFHGTHPGWHCHIACCPLADVEPGQGHPRSAARFPGGTSEHRRQAFDMSESSALSAVFNFFRVVGAPEGSML
jgi:hypothetical protein